MEEDIINFLPQYSNINNYDYSFLNPYDNFYESIYEKKEFYDEKLEKIESVKKDNPLKHQKIIARFMSSYTPYDQLLLLHEMGSGKTFSAINSIEQIKKENSTFTGAIILARGEGIIENFKSELIERTGLTYLPKNYNYLTKGEQVARKNKLIKEYYTFYTFYEFAKLLSGVSDNTIKQQFSNKIIVIDEVHNVRLKEETKVKNKEGILEKETIYVYNQFYRFLHVVNNCKVLLMSGTPIKDTIDEFANIINLIIPEDKKLPTKNNFINNFFDYDKDIEKEDRIYTLKKKKKKELKELLKGRVSYLKSITSDVKKEFIGDKNVGKLRHFIVYKDLMSLIQSKFYKEVYELYQ